MPKVKPVEYVLKGSEYVIAHPNKAFPRAAKVMYDDLPPELRATEQRIRGSNGARDPRWLARHLRWLGCQRAVPIGEVWIRCPHEPTESGICKMHSRANSAAQQNHDA